VIFHLVFIHSGEIWRDFQPGSLRKKYLVVHLPAMSTYGKSQFLMGKLNINGVSIAFCMFTRPGRLHQKYSPRTPEKDVKKCHEDMIGKDFPASDALCDAVRPEPDFCALGEEQVFLLNWNYPLVN